MSTTFFVPGLPEHTVVEMIDGERFEWPETTPPSVNCNNTHAALLLRLMGLAADSRDPSCGAVEVQALPLLLSRLGKLRDDWPASVRSAVVAPSDTQEPGCARVIDLGIDEHRIESALRRIHELATAARRIGRPMRWG